jgi:arsenical pump membrane protein
MLAHEILASLGEAWPPFVLVAGLLMIGAVAAEDGLFEAIGARLSQARLGGSALLLATLGLVAAVTAVLNLDTAVVFLTPVLVHAARRRGLDERPFLYGSVFMANAASLLLPASNLTNLLVLRNEPQRPAAFAAQMLPAWVAACAVTGTFLVLAFRLGDGTLEQTALPPLRLSIGVAATLTAAALVVALPSAALPVLVVGIAATAVRRLRPRVDVRTLALLFTLTVALGTAARLLHGAEQVFATKGVWATAGIAALAAVLVNNLPATMFLSAQPVAHPHALLIGLDVGPNLAVTGSLSAVLWMTAARAVGSPASIVTYSRLGLMLAPPTLLLALAVSSAAHL